MCYQRIVCLLKQCTKGILEKMTRVTALTQKPATEIMASNANYFFQYKSDLVTEFCSNFVKILSELQNSMQFITP